MFRFYNCNPIFGMKKQPLFQLEGYVYMHCDM